MPARICNSLNSGIITYIARIYSDFIYSSFSSTERKLIIKMNISYKRYIHCIFNRLNKIKSLLVRNSKANYLASGRCKFLCLLNRTFNIACRNIKHTLNKNRTVTADKCIGEFYFFTFSSFHNFHPKKILKELCYIAESYKAHQCKKCCKTDSVD